MSVAPAVLTDPILTTHESQPVVLVTSEEILTVRTPAYSHNKSDISFLVRQPSGSAICSSYCELQLELIFTLSDNTTVRRKFVNGIHDTLSRRYRKKMPDAPVVIGTTNPANLRAAISQNSSDYGFVPELLPIQNKCVRNAVITINGSSQSMRVNEFGKEYNLLHLNRKMANKIGGGINDYKKKPVYRSTARALAGDTFSGRFAPGVGATADQAGGDSGSYSGFRDNFVDSDQQNVQRTLDVSYDRRWVYK